MNRVISLAIVLGLCVVGLTKASSQDAQVFVSTIWLADHLKDPSLVVLHVTQYRREYDKGHIPGARFLWPGSLAASNTELSYELVPLAQLDSVLEGLGVSNNSRIILCGVGGNVSPTARMFVTLDYLGMGDRTSILDGGLDAWKAEGRPVSKDVPKIKRTRFTPHLRRDAIIDASVVHSDLHKPGVSIIDARSSQYYNGEGGGFPRKGHIPGAVNIYFETLVDSTNKMLSPSTLRGMFTTAGVKQGDEVITYCHVGQTACVDYVAARSLGYKVHLYDGSFEDWSGREDLPIELSGGKAATGK